MSETGPLKRAAALRALDEVRHELYDRSLIVIVSDHGEGLGDHVETDHAIQLVCGQLRQ